MEVLNELGHGLHEKPYENALAVELKLRGLTIEQQCRFDVFYKNVVVSDIVVEREVVVDTKVVEKITDHERGQMLNYLKITKLKVGLILNFRRAKLEWDRLVL